jgi:sigma-54 dependent transcriptional regulator, acetoin dehydrogenase operon transcriptional activator AcoR
VARRILLTECPQGTPEISPHVSALFNRYAWPGNIRQLANVLRTAAVMATGAPQITEHHLSDDFLEDVQRVRSSVPAAAPAIAAPAASMPPDVPAPVSVDRPAELPIAPLPAEAAHDGTSSLTLGEAEIEMIRAALAAANGNISTASKRLGISRNTIYRKLRWGKDS